MESNTRENQHASEELNLLRQRLTQWQRELETKEKQIEEQERALKDRINAFDETKKRVTKQLNKKAIVNLNIGGTLFSTTLETLTPDNEIFFANVFEDNEPKQDETLFIDRDPSHFPIILNYLRGVDVTKQIEKLTQEQKHQLEQDVDFYNIRSMFNMFPSLHRRQHFVKEFKGIIATGAYDCTIRVWNINTNELICTLVSPTNISALLVLKDGTLVSACNSHEKSITLWNINETHKPIHINTGYVAGLADLGDFKIASQGDIIRVWDVTTQELVAQKDIRNLDIHPTGYPTIVALSKTKIAVGCTNSTLFIWDYVTNEECRIKCAFKDFVGVVTVLDDDRVACASPNDHVIEVIDVNTYESVRTITSAHRYGIDIVVLSNGNILTIGGEGVIKVWDSNFNHLFDTNTRISNGVSKRVAALDGGKVAIMRRNDVVVLDTETDQELLCCTGHTQALSSLVAFFY